MSVPHTFGLIGKGISHSLSPTIFRHIFALTGDPGVFRVLDFSEERLESVLAQCREWDGFSVTIPYKREIIPYLAEIYGTAEDIGAVNSVRVSEGRFYGYNTDAAGFKAPLEETGFSGRRFLILGTGGAARAILYALLTSYPEASIAVCGRRRTAIDALLEKCAVWGCVTGHMHGLTFDELQADEKFDLIVNCTPVGGAGSVGNSPLPESFSFRGCDLCYDLLYWPELTEFLEAAGTAGCRRLNGLPMLVRQAVESYILWTGRDRDATSLSAAILARLKEEGEDSSS